MAFILSDTMLDKLVCSVCEKYLSVLPVKVYPGGFTKCGRCSDKDDNGALSLYDSVVQNYFFKCVNRYDGCNKLLTPSEVLTHEKNCVSEGYSCPKCQDSCATAFELLRHYKKDHSSSILEKNTFLVPAKEIVQERYLYVIEDKVFFILVENMPHEQCLYLRAVSLKPGAFVNQQFFVKLLRKPTTGFTTDITRCTCLKGFKCDYYKIEYVKLNPKKFSCKFNLDLSQCYNFVSEISFASKETNKALPETKTASKSIQTAPTEAAFGVKITDIFKAEYPQYKLTPCGTALFKNDDDRIELTCSNCGEFTGSNTFNCRSTKHVVCWECNAWCGICDSPIEGWDAGISSVNELLLLPCRWKCGGNFSGDQLRNHVSTCELNIRKCPERLCRLTKMSVLQLEAHLICFHKIELFTQFSLTSYLKGTRTSVPIYFLQNNFLFRMAWTKSNNSYEVFVTTTENVKEYELLVIYDNKTYQKPIKNRICFTLDNNPKFYLRQVKWPVCYYN